MAKPQGGPRKRGLRLSAAVAHTNWLEQAEAATAVREVAQATGASLDEVTAVMEVAAWGRVASRERIDRELRFDALSRALAVGMPDPVLTVTGTARLEVPWTNYIFGALGGEVDANSSPGNALALALYRGLTARHAEAVEVLREVPLGGHKCRECDAGEHGCSLDLVILCRGEAAVGIEHKVKSGPSDFVYTGCEHKGKQALAYKDLFFDWCRARGVEGTRVWLSPGGGSRDDWTPRSHLWVATTLAPALSRLETFGERYRGAAFILDLAAGVIDQFGVTMRAVRRYHDDPDSDTAAQALLSALERKEHHAIIHGVLDAIVK